MDHILRLVQLNEKRTSTNREGYQLFVNPYRIYDTVPVEKLWEVLEKSPINNTAIKAIKQLYEQARSRIKLESNTSDSF